MLLCGYIKNINFIIMPIVTSATERGLCLHLCLFVCLYVCLFACPLDYPQNYERSFVKFFGGPIN